MAGRVPGRSALSHAGPSALAGKGCNPNYFNVAWQNDNLHEAAGGYANSAGFQNSFILINLISYGTIIFRIKTRVCICE